MASPVEVEHRGQRNGAHASGELHLAFERRLLLLGLQDILPLRTAAFDKKQHGVYRRIVTSIKRVGLVEPLAVFPAAGQKGKYTLLDGHLRLWALRELGIAQAKCLVATADEAYTYNHKVSRVSPIQEHFMILKALESGVPERRIAEALDVDVPALRRKRDLLLGICEEAVELLKERKASAGAMRHLRKVKPLRQIEIAELMVAQKNFSEAYAAILFAATRRDQVLEPEKPREVRGLRPDDMSRMEKELEHLSDDFRAIKESHRQNTLNLVLASGYLRKLLDNAAVVRHLSQHHADVLAEFHKVVAATTLEG
jgi:ParB-like chromosome segregation protein Spo0J